MNIAILAPSPYTFVTGGAEYFYLGLQRYINECTSHACELVKIPTRESSLPELMAAYRQHAQADLRGFDRLVSSKYPAWMASHPNHTLYMLHTLRGLYDSYHFMKEPIDPVWPRGLGEIKREIDQLQRARPGNNDAVFSLLDTIDKAVGSGRIALPFSRFPGPLARYLVHALDRFAMQPARIVSYATMSRTVAARPGYFPKGVECSVVHPPPRLEGFRCGSDDYLFTVSRLDVPKRIGLLIEAMRHVKADIPLLIAGTGSDAARLQALAAGDARIRFLGQIDDEQLLDTYANALAVPFVPYQEDYGLVTIEAMRSAKPVLTVHDAGGVTEFVHHGVTGLCVDANPVALGAAIDELCADRPRTRSMGRAARRLVAGISWKPLAEQVLGVALPDAPVHDRRAAITPRRGRRKAVVALTFGVTPPRGGGQSRAFHLYKSLAEHMDIVLVCLCESSDVESRAAVAPGLVEVRVPKSAEHQQLEFNVCGSVNCVPVADIVGGCEVQLTPRFLDVLHHECANADAVIACHPYFTSTLRAAYPELAFWYEAQDVELTLKRGLLPAGRVADTLLARVEAEERQAWLEASVVYACTDEDLKQLHALYGPTTASCFTVPNGYCEDEVVFCPPAARPMVKAELNMGSSPLVIFIGSWHGPNLDAVERIIGYAEALPHVTFAVIGSAGLFFRERTVPDNLRLVGAVGAEEKQVLLAAADLAINPMTSGTGSNLKMLDYFGAGVPVLSTSFGARGITALPGRHYLACEAPEFLAGIVRFLLDPAVASGLVESARHLAHTEYSWRAIGRKAAISLGRRLP